MVIFQESNINPFSKEGHVLEHLDGNIELHDCDFSYPTRSDQDVRNKTLQFIYIYRLKKFKFKKNKAYVS